MAKQVIPEFTPVKSSNIVGIAYNAEEKEMHIKFSKGQIYKYFPIEQNMYDNIINAPSVGKAFRAEVYGAEDIQTEKVRG